jgi:hypothetical protein
MGKMKKAPRKNTKRCWFSICALMFGLLPPFSAQAAVERRASIEASGEAAIFDVKATADGTLRVGTKAGRAGDRWRVAIVMANTPGAVSKVGNGSTTAFSGYASRSVVANAQYLVIVTWDRPLPGTFPAEVTVRFTGATDETDPPVVQRNGKPLADILPRPTIWVEPPPEGCPGEGAALRCQSLVTCELNPASDTDTFKVTVPDNTVLSINVPGPSSTEWTIYDSEGNPVNDYCRGRCDVAISDAGTYTILIYNGWNNTGSYTVSLLGVSTAFRCGPVLTPGASPRTWEFEKAGDTDSFQLNNVVANETYSINIMGPDWTYWAIYDPDGNPVGSSCSGKCNVKLTKSGDYTVLVYNSYNNIGEYSLSVQKIGS